MGVIYSINNKINDKKYIGKTIRPIEVRWNEHLRDVHNPQKNNNNKLYRAMNKHGIDSFSIEILEDDVPNELLGKKEQYYIKLFNSYYEGYNSTFGGEGESMVDIEPLKELYLLGKNFSEIAEITGHSRKTVSTRLRKEGMESPCKGSSGYLNKGKPVLFNNQEFASLTLLAKHLQLNIDPFKEKEVNTIIKGISKSARLNCSYCGYYFKYL